MDDFFAAIPNTSCIRRIRWADCCERVSPNLGDTHAPYRASGLSPSTPQTGMSHNGGCRSTGYTQRTRGYRQRSQMVADTAMSRGERCSGREVLQNPPRGGILKYRLRHRHARPVARCHAETCQQGMQAPETRGHHAVRVRPELNRQTCRQLHRDPVGCARDKQADADFDMRHGLFNIRARPLYFPPIFFSAFCPFRRCAWRIR